MTALARAMLVSLASSGACAGELVRERTELVESAGGITGWVWSNRELSVWRKKEVTTQQ
jgi:hypothetical protein